MGTKLVVMSSSGPRWEWRLPVRSALDAPQGAAYAAVCYAVVCFGEDHWLRSEMLGLYPCISPCCRTGALLRRARPDVYVRDMQHLEAYRPGTSPLSLALQLRTQVPSNPAITTSPNPQKLSPKSASSWPSHHMARPFFPMVERRLVGTYAIE